MLGAVMFAAALCSVLTNLFANAGLIGSRPISLEVTQATRGAFLSASTIVWLSIIPIAVTNAVIWCLHDTQEVTYHSKEVTYHSRNDDGCRCRRRHARRDGVSQDRTCRQKQTDKANSAICAFEVVIFNAKASTFLDPDRPLHQRLATGLGNKNRFC